MILQLNYVRNTFNLLVGYVDELLLPKFLFFIIACMYKSN